MDISDLWNMLAEEIKNDWYTYLIKTIRNDNIVCLKSS